MLEDPLVSGVGLFKHGESLQVTPTEDASPVGVPPAPNSPCVNVQKRELSSPATQDCVPSTEEQPAGNAIRQYPYKERRPPQHMSL